MAAFFNQLKNKALDVAMNFTAAEVKVREATDPEEAWGPTGTQMNEIAAATFKYEEYAETMGMLWKRILKDSNEGKNWRRIYKGLLVLAHLLRNGADRVVESARDHISELRNLEHFEFTDVKGKDQGINVRHKVQELIGLINDDERLRAERAKAKATKDKYTGVSVEDLKNGTLEEKARVQSRPVAYDAPQAPSDEEDFDPRSSGAQAAPAKQQAAAPAHDDFGDFSTAPGQQPVAVAFSAPAKQPTPAAAPVAAKPVVNLLDDFDSLSFTSAPKPAAQPAAAPLSFDTLQPQSASTSAAPTSSAPAAAPLSNTTWAGLNLDFNLGSSTASSKPAEPVRPLQLSSGPTYSAPSAFAGLGSLGPQGFGAPMQPAYGQPLQPGFGQPLQPGFPQPGFGQPLQPAYGQPLQPAFGQPLQPGFGQPQGFAQPQQGFNQFQGFGAAPQQGYGQPAQNQGFKPF